MLKSLCISVHLFFFFFRPSEAAFDKCSSHGGGGALGAEQRLTLPVEYRDPPQPALTLSLFVISVQDKGHGTQEEHAFLMRHPHQIHNGGLSGMPMALYSSSNYRRPPQLCGHKAVKGTSSSNMTALKPTIHLP